MPDKKIYSKVMPFHEFCIWYLDITPKSEDEMQKVFMEFESGEIKIKKGVMIEGGAMGGGFFATTKAEFKRISKGSVNPKWVKVNSALPKWSDASIIDAILGVEIPQCNHLVVLHFLAFDNEVRVPTKDDAKGDENWVAGGRTKNLITRTTDEGVEEVVIKPLPAVERIKEVDYIGHVDYNL